MAEVARPKSVGILGMGHMGSGVGAELARAGFDVVTCLAGRSERTRNRAREAGVRDAGDLRALIAECDTFLSIVPADQAEPLAAEVAQCLNAKPLHFVDNVSDQIFKFTRIQSQPFLSNIGGHIFVDFTPYLLLWQFFQRSQIKLFQDFLMQCCFRIKHRL